jgi:hypothetical protein
MSLHQFSEGAGVASLGSLDETGIVIRVGFAGLTLLVGRSSAPAIHGYDNRIAFR